MWERRKRGNIECPSYGEIVGGKGERERERKREGGREREYSP